MKVALLSLAVLGAQFTTLASDRVPQVNVDALCKAMSADARLMRMAVSRTVADCVSQENDAKRSWTLSGDQLPDQFAISAKETESR
jgi:hypothetical protein